MGVLVIGFIILLLIIERPKWTVNRRKIASVILVLFLVILLIMSALSAFIYY
nr:hypothetical protein [uncultured archaeon]